MEVYARMRAAIKRGHFWAYGPLVCTTAHGRALVFERRNFFSEAATALKAIPGGEATPDLSDLERGITTGHVLRKERYLEVSKFLYRALLAGTFAPRTSHTFSSGLTPQLLLDVFQAINFNNRSIWFEGRTLEARGQSMSVTVSHVRLPRLSRLFRLRPHVRNSLSFVTDDVSKVVIDGTRLVLVVAGRPYSISVNGIEVVELDGLLG